MKERIVTSIVLIVGLILVGLIDNRYLTALVLSIVGILALYEAKNLLKVEERIFYFLSFLTILAIFIDPIFLAVIGILIVASYIAYFQKDLIFLFLAFYPFLSLMLLFKLYFVYEMGSLVFLILVVALTDSFAYLIGKNLGKRFIKNGFCKTSPNKSWEGVIGGVVVAVIIGSVLGLYMLEFFKAFYIALFVSIFSVFGDLFESYLKRRAGVKDSGNILPGHGGVLDRIDGYLFAAPIMYVLM